MTIAATEVITGHSSVDLGKMDLEAYRKNPVIFLNHESWRLPIARTTKICRGKDGIDVEFEFLSGNGRAEEIKNAWENGFIRGASIGWSKFEDRNGEEIARLREWSIVTFPADAKALRTERCVEDCHCSREDNSPSDPPTQADPAPDPQPEDPDAEKRQKELDKLRKERADLALEKAQHTYRELIAEGTTFETEHALLEHVTKTENPNTEYLRGMADIALKQRKENQKLADEESKNVNPVYRDTRETPMNFFDYQRLQ